MKKPRYLTKSRFKIGSECPTKLNYANKKDYANQKLEDSFLEALAEGGFQVGELAKCYYPNGYDIKSLDYEESERQTLSLLQRDNVVIFEPAIRFNNLFIRIDVLIKNGNHFQLIEVKAKSYSSKSDGDLMNKSGKLDSKWKPYLYDVAFQTYVLKKAFPKSTVDSYLMLVDKEAKALKDGLNQKFKITSSNNQKSVEISPAFKEEDLASKLLTKVNVNKNIQYIFEKELLENTPGDNFEQQILNLANHYENDIRITPIIGTKCKSCEYRCKTQDEMKNLKDGFKQCWKEQLHWNDTDFNEATVLDIWNFRRAGQLIEKGIIKAKDLTEEDVGVDEVKSATLSSKERQWLQIEKIKKNDNSIYLDTDSIINEMSTWTFPLHFIDFETSTVALPFYKGMAPYEVVAFQFSHHTVDKNGDVTHVGEFLETTPGVFPNFEFVRELKKQLSQDQGTIFRFSSHENTVLNQIREQLLASNEPDIEELCDFIESITKSRSSQKGRNWCGERNMVDLCELVKRYYYDPQTGGSNSIKAVLPAVLNSSEYLKTKYNQPIYGNQIESLNFVDKVWIKLDENNQPIDPYKQLPKMFTDNEQDNIEFLSSSNELNNGGLALTAYAKCQFIEMSEYERQELNSALLKYCELDTLAMVMIYEAWKDWCENGI